MRMSNANIFNDTLYTYFLSCSCIRSSRLCLWLWSTNGEILIQKYGEISKSLTNDCYFILIESIRIFMKPMFWLTLSLTGMIYSIDLKSMRDGKPFRLQRRLKMLYFYSRQIQEIGNTKHHYLILISVWWWSPCGWVFCCSGWLCRFN